MQVFVGFVFLRETRVPCVRHKPALFISQGRWGGEGSVGFVFSAVFDTLREPVLHRDSLGVGLRTEQGQKMQHPLSVIPVYSSNSIFFFFVFSRPQGLLSGDGVASIN